MFEWTTFILIMFAAEPNHYQLPCNVKFQTGQWTLVMQNSSSNCQKIQEATGGYKDTRLFSIESFLPFAGGFVYASVIELYVLVMPLDFCLNTKWNGAAGKKAGGKNIHEKIYKQLESFIRFICCFTKHRHNQKIQ